MIGTLFSTNKAYTDW